MANEHLIGTTELFDHLRLHTDEPLAATIDELETRFRDMARLIEAGRRLREKAQEVGEAVNELGALL